MVLPLHDNLSKLEEMRRESMQGGGEDRIAAQHQRGKLTARERIDLLLDAGSFEEFDILKTGRGGSLGEDAEKASYSRVSLIGSVFNKFNAKTGPTFNISSTIL